jgi:hypothetical protein
MTSGFAFAGQAQANIIIDDWNVTSSVNAESNVAGTSQTMSRLGSTNGGNFWGERGNAYANLISGDQAQTQDCSNCLQGHGTEAANSLGNGFWEWTSVANPMSISGTVSLLYDADLAGGDIVATFVGDIIQEIWWSDIFAGPQNLTGNISVKNVTAIYLDWFSVGGDYDPFGDSEYSGVVTARNFGIGVESLDFSVDTFQVSAPTSAVLTSLGLLALGWRGSTK